MCGIAGFAGPWPPRLLDAMIASLRHRGPDGEGRFVDAAPGVALGHTRLSIIDLSDAAAQPMTSSDGRYTIVFNGEIYNYKALRDGLAQQGATFRSHSDTEVLLTLYARDGRDCLKRLNGIFAFAVWDAERHELFLARDHLGVKPLYYAALSQGFLFSSELKTLTLCPDLPRDIDRATVSDHLGFLWTAGERTMLSAVKKLRPGCCLTVRAGKVETQRFYRVPLAAGDDAPPGSASDLTKTIDSIVADQMVADVDVGALLSGGVDSSAIVAAMCQATDPARITTFCAAVPKESGAADNFGDDRHFARQVATKLGVKLIEVPTEADLIERLPWMIWTLDEPTADFAALQTLMLAEAARDAGIKVLLSGVGGDDLFTGYGRHTAGLLYAIAGSIPGAHTLGGALFRALPPSSILGRRLKRIGALFAQSEDVMLAEAMSYSAVEGPARLDLLAPDVRAEAPAGGIPVALRQSLDRTRGLHPVNRFLDLELNGFLPDHNLNYTDKMAMQAGVEVRVPLVDPRLVDYAMKLPLKDKIDLRTTKKILRDSQRARLPESVLTRPKQGFGVPLRAWLRGAARPMLEELTAPDVLASRGLFDAPSVARLKDDFFSGRTDAAFTLFPIVAIELWCRALDAAPRAALG